MEQGVCSVAIQVHVPDGAVKEEARRSFSEIVHLIEASREKALQVLNAILIDLYWKIGATIIRKIEDAEWDEPSARKTISAQIGGG